VRVVVTLVAVVATAVPTVVAVAIAVVVPKIDTSDRLGADDAPELHDLAARFGLDTELIPMKGR
jgi:hypothetical protein